jgi:WD40 repeat protein
MDVVNSVAFSPDGFYIASNGIDGSVLLWDVLTGNRMGRFGEYTDNLVRSVAFSPDGLLMGVLLHTA